MNDSKNSTLPPSQIEHDNIPGALLRSGEMAGGQLNPAWVEWLMGWPIGWTSLAALHEREFEHWQATNAEHGDGAPADELWFSEEAGAPSGDHGERQAIPRVSSGVQARAARIKALGNGQVPRAAAAAWRLLTGANDV